MLFLSVSEFSEEIQPQVHADLDLFVSSMKLTLGIFTY